MHKSTSIQLGSGSDDSVELGGVFKCGVDHLNRGNLCNFLASLHEVEPVAADLPCDAVTTCLSCLGSLLLVLCDESLELGLVINHEHLRHVTKAEVLVGAFSATCNLVPDCVHKLLDEEVVGDLGHVVLLLQDFLVAALYEVSLEGDRDLNVDVGFDVFLRDELNLSVVL